MAEYTVTTLKKDFPQLASVQNSLYLTPILSYFIHQFIPYFMSEWSVEKGFCTDIRWDWQENPTKTEKNISADFIIKGKINSIMIWSIKDGVYGLDYMGTSQLFSSKGPCRHRFKVREMIRFYGPSDVQLSKKFGSFIGTFKLKEVIPDVLKSLEKEMTENCCEDINGEPCISELKTLLLKIEN